MEHVIIANYSVSGGPGDLPVENVALDYGTIQYIYVEKRHSDENPFPESVKLNRKTGKVE